MNRETYALKERERERVDEGTNIREVHPLVFCVRRAVSYLNSFSDFPRRSRTSHWVVKASWGGIP